MRHTERHRHICPQTCGATLAMKRKIGARSTGFCVGCTLANTSTRYSPRVVLFIAEEGEESQMAWEGANKACVTRWGARNGSVDIKPSALFSQELSCGDNARLAAGVLYLYAIMHRATTWTIHKTPCSFLFLINLLLFCWGLQPCLLY